MSDSLDDESGPVDKPASLEEQNENVDVNKGEDDIEIDSKEDEKPIEGDHKRTINNEYQTKEGEEGEENAEKEIKKKKRVKIEKPQIAEDFYHDYDSLLFKPIISEESNLKNDLLKMYHSFGYDCRKRSNLNILDEETLIFSAGNLVQMLNIKTKKQTYLKATGGGAIGAIMVHPSHRYFAVGEKGRKPNINIYEYPSLKLYRVLPQGTLKSYVSLDFDPQGNYLASQGGEPDYMLTIWDWKQETIVLRTKSFSQEIFKVTFSKDLKGILTTSGSGHIK
jgi:hypothetical protein